MANQSLECLDQKLGSVQNWTKEGNAPLAKDMPLKVHVTILGRACGEGQFAWFATFTTFTSSDI